MSKQQLGDLKINHSGCFVCSVSFNRLPNTFTQQWLEIMFGTLVKCAHGMLSEIYTSICHQTCIGFQVIQCPSSLFEPIFFADVVSLLEFPLEEKSVENPTDGLRRRLERLLLENPANLLHLQVLPIDHGPWRKRPDLLPMQTFANHSMVLLFGVRSLGKWFFLIRSLLP